MEPIGERQGSMAAALKAAVGYFLVVFAAGFALALIRVPLLVPRFGVRAAELIELPLMAIVIGVVSYRVARRHAGWPRARRFGIGGLALVLMVGAELVVATGLGQRSIAEALAGRDPVSGAVYLVALLWFALAPAVWPGRK